MLVLRRYAGLLAAVGAAVLVAEFVPSVGTRQAASRVIPAPAGVASLVGTPGLTVGGVRCGPGVRQVLWSAYAPLCIPAWHGDNGGATARGVTATTIIVTYREASTAEMSALYSIVPKATIGTDAQVIADLKAYVSLFNRVFELYGRKVVLVPFKGQSDFVSELAGGDQQAAQADAATARSLHAFADLSIIDATPTYDAALAEEHIISINPYGGTEAQYQQFAPYEYSTAPLCRKGNLGIAAFVAEMLARRPVSFAGDPSLNGRRRVFGLLEDSTPQGNACTDELLRLLAARKVRVARVVGIALDPSTLVSEAQTAVAELESAGVTTVIASGLDFVTPILIARAAEQQHYYPEWVLNDLMDGFTRLVAEDEVSHAVALGVEAGPKAETEAVRAFEMARPHADLATELSPAYRFVYEPVLLLFDALQQAGPRLTAASFEQGFQSLPPSLPGGMYGLWRFGPGSFDPVGGFGVVRWDPTAVSNEDGLRGSWVACDGGKQFPLDGIVAAMARAGPLRCPG
jgi:hypothetical protein